MAAGRATDRIVAASDGMAAHDQVVEIRVADLRFAQDEADQLLRHRIALINAEQWQHLERCIGEFPREVVDESVALPLSEAAVAYSRFRKADFEQLLDRAESLIASRPQSPERVAPQGEINGWRTYTLGVTTLSRCGRSRASRDRQQIARTFAPVPI